MYCSQAAGPRDLLVLTAGHGDDDRPCGCCIVCRTAATSVDTGLIASAG